MDKLPGDIPARRRMARVDYDLFRPTAEMLDSVLEAVETSGLDPAGLVVRYRPYWYDPGGYLVQGRAFSTVGAAKTACKRRPGARVASELTIQGAEVSRLVDGRWVDAPRT